MTKMVKIPREDWVNLNEVVGASTGAKLRMENQGIGATVRVIEQAEKPVSRAVGSLLHPGGRFGSWLESDGVSDVWALAIGKGDTPVNVEVVS